MADKTVGDLMHRGVIACKLATPMDEVIRIVSDTDVHAIVVMDETNHALGVISHMDIIQFFGQDIASLTARDVMSGTVIDIEVGKPAKEAADLMLGKKVHRLLVVRVEGKQRKPVGIISTTDLVKEMRASRWVWYMG